MNPSSVAFVCIGGIFLILLAICLWDSWLYTDKIERNSITQVTIDYSKKYPIIAWSIGFFMGFLSAHLYG